MGTLDATVFVHSDTEITTRVWRDTKVGIIATAAFDGLTIYFAPHYEESEVDGMLAACDRLGSALSDIRERIAGLAVAA